MKKLFALGVLAVLTGCSSQTLQPPKYYVLNGHSVSIESEKASEKGPEIAMGTINLSDYLRSSNMVLQVSDHELFFSTNHLWAEPLKVGVEKTLASVFDHRNSFALTPDFIVDVKIDYFHIVDKQSVVLSGSYVIENKDKDPLTQARFSLSRPLKDSGYEYAVSEMTAVLLTLAEDIEKAAAKLQAKDAK